MHDHENPYNCEPPGTFLETIPHPGGFDRTIEKAIIMEHRFSFVFWMKWRNTLYEKGTLSQDAPTLVTLDWHRDLAPPSDSQKATLEKLDQSDIGDVANYVWAQFDQTNDGHILCAAWLNLVGDVILLKNSAGDIEETFTDKNGKQHSIFEFRDYKKFEQFLLSRNDQNIFLDIDLDYFVHGKSTRDGYLSDDFSCYSDDEIGRVIDYRHPVFQHILSHIDGITIAEEPAYCGGISNSCHIMETVHSQLFDAKHNWKHLKEKNSA